VPRIAGATDPSTTSAQDSTTNAAVTAAKRPQKSRPVALRTHAAATPAAPITMTRMAVQFSHLSTGCAVSLRGRSASSPAAPTATPATGPKTTAANTQMREATEASAEGVNLMLSCSAPAARIASTATAVGCPSRKPASNSPRHTPTAPAHRAATQSLSRSSCRGGPSDLLAKLSKASRIFLETLEFSPKRGITFSCRQSPS